MVFEYSKLSRNKLDHEDFETLSSSRAEDIQEVSDGKIRLVFDEADEELLPKESKFHSLIALNIHTYATEQIAFLDPAFDPRLVPIEAPRAQISIKYFSLIKRNKIMRLRNPSISSAMRAKRKLLCL